MPAAKTQVFRHVFTGGWATDFGPSVDASPDPSGKIAIPFLLDAQDLVYELDGGPHEIGGTSRVNASAVASGGTVTGVYDYWKQGTGGIPSRRRVIHAGTTILSDTDDGVFTNTLFSGLTSGAVPSYSTFDDLLIISSDSGTDVPKSWDQTTAQALSGSPPIFAFSCSHKNRVWAAGAIAKPSRLYYCDNVDPQNWAGGASGSIDIDPNDGDGITGIASHKNDLWVFKGPNKGSIHRITGSSPTGSDGFARTTYVTGLGAAWHNAIFKFSDDLGFVSQFGSVHALSASQNYGDFIEAALSRPINRWIRQHLNYSKLRKIWTATDPLLGLVYIIIPIDASTTNNVCLVMDFRAAPDVLRWSRVPSYAFASVGLFVDTNGLRQVMSGGYDGYVRRINITDRSIDGASALSFKATTPYMNYGNPMMMKTLECAAIGFAPKGNFTTTFGWQRDNAAQQTVTLAQSGADVLGAASANQFTLGTSTLGGGQFIDVYTELNQQGGEFRSVQYEVRQSAVNQDIEFHSITVSVTPGALSTENV